jgi:ParB-like chromosome segregation protein Spo0J
MVNIIRSIRLDKLVAHPDNPNQQSKVVFGKLVRNIERTGRYEPILVRPHPKRRGYFQIINGEHRFKVLAKLGYKTADCIVWDIDDEQTYILLATLNRLVGTDKLDKKLSLMKRLNKEMKAYELAKLLPQTSKQIEQLINLKMSRSLMSVKDLSYPSTILRTSPMVFFVNDAQQETIEKAISSAVELLEEKTKAAKRAAALTHIAGEFLDQRRKLTAENTETEGRG